MLAGYQWGALQLPSDLTPAHQQARPMHKLFYAIEGSFEFYIFILDAGSVNISQELWGSKVTLYLDL